MWKSYICFHLKIFLLILFQSIKTEEVSHKCHDLNCDQLELKFVSSSDQNVSLTLHMIRQNVFTSNLKTLIDSFDCLYQHYSGEI